MKYQVALDYTVPFGDLTPYADALSEGRAFASACSDCGIVAYPARTTCGACGNGFLKWHELSGSAQIVCRTDGVAGSFALVQFEGAGTRSTVAIKNPEMKTTSGSLVAPPTDRPGLWLALDDKHKGHG